MNRYKLNNEFFGGIVYDRTKKKEIYVDKLMYNLMAIFNESLSLEEKQKAIKEITKYSKIDIIDIFRILIENKFIYTNIDYSFNEIVPYLSKPFRVFYDITYKCNLKCKHCFTNSGLQHVDELTLEEKLAMLEDFSSFGINKISIAGGEPFISEHLFPFLEKCLNLNIDVSITTNGTLLTQENISKLNDYKVKNLTISFDGYDEKSFDFIRGNGVFNKVIKTIKLLNLYYKYKFSIKVTVMKSNFSKIEEFLKLSIFHNVKYIKFNTVRADGRCLKYCDLILKDNEYHEYLLKVEKLKKIYGKKITIKSSLNPFSDEEYDYISELGFGCFAGKESICINPLGEVKPCSHFPKAFICGNIKKDKIKDIWQNSNILKKFRTFKGNEKCKSCNIYDKCRAGCRYRAYILGDINGVDPYCFKNAGGYQV
ncbi:radical SAM/SPASM domain-containing protein [Fusobacterium polymorphum]|uniref:radical SAM/SPASM domain-containing protein n=1 Tax=Fusobacterium nucleatum subsp. polymorphum TaxID=76857 RepID=UPI0022E1D262|nr:radical SAM protein [Fusobacterium polymorphum]